MYGTTQQASTKASSVLKRLKQIGASLLLIGATLANSTSTYAQSAADPDAAKPKIFLPLVVSSSNTVNQNQNGIPGQYIVVFKQDQVTASSVSSVAAAMVTEAGGEILQTYDAALQGFAARFPVEKSAAAVTRLQQDPRVAYVEQDAMASISQEPNADNGQAPDAYTKKPLESGENIVDAASTEEIKSPDKVASIDTIQTGAVWGLDRNDQHFLPLNGRYIYFNTGANVRAYIIDTGIRIAHSQFFPNRARYGFDAVDGALPADDCHGHGTHVAGTVGGVTYGVAKQVQLIAVRVLDCTGHGPFSTIIAGVNWVTIQKRLNPSIPSVANMSLGALVGTAPTALDQAIFNSISAGVTYVVSAGNDNAPACNYTPAHTLGTITVGATDITDTRAWFSNFGGCVDIFAPGVSILSAGLANPTATAMMSGTSMSAPHVTGVVALYLQGHPTATPATVRANIFGVATSGIVKNPGAGSFNRLVYNPY